MIHSQSTIVLRSKIILRGKCPRRSFGRVRLLSIRTTVLASYQAALWVSVQVSVSSNCIMDNNSITRRSCLRKAHGLANLTVPVGIWPGYLPYVLSPIIKRFYVLLIIFPVLSFAVVV